MEYIEQIWNRLECFPVPEKEEIEKSGMPEIIDNDILFQDGHVTGWYIKIQQLYKFIFSMILVAESGLDRLDKRFENEHFKEAEQKDFYQKYDLMGLRYIYLRSFVHIERLTYKQIIFLKECIEKKESDRLSEIIKLVKETLKEVISICPSKLNQQFELFPSLYGEGLVYGRDIVFGIRSIAEYNENGIIKDSEAEERRINIFYNVCNQLENILAGILDTGVSVILDL